MLLNNLKTRSGQALVELAIGLGVAVFLASAGVGMLRYSLAAPWVDELLLMRLNTDSPPSAEEMVKGTERSGWLPEYLRAEDLSFRRTEQPRTTAPLPLHRKVRAGMRTDKAALRLQPAEGRIIPAATSSGIYAGTMERRLGVVTYHEPKEHRVRQSVSDVYLFGLARGAVTTAARTFGIDILHVNLDSLPADAAQGDPKR